MAGCTGQTIEGRWHGPFPFAGTRECDLSLRGDRTATIACDGTKVVGAGRYEWDGSRLEVAFPTLTRDARRVAAEGPFAFKIQGQGNRMRASSGGTVYKWTRTIR